MEAVVLLRELRVELLVLHFQRPLISWETSLGLFRSHLQARSSWRIGWLIRQPAEEGSWYSLSTLVTGTILPRISAES